MLFFPPTFSIFLSPTLIPLSFPPSLFLSSFFFPSSLSPSPELQELGIAVSQLAQRTGRHMGGLFCNPAGHTTLAQGRGWGGWWDARREGSGREDWAGLYYYLPTYTFRASLCLWADGLSLFSHWWREVSPRYILSAHWGFRNRVEKGRKEGNEEERKWEWEEVWEWREGWIEDWCWGRDAPKGCRLNQWSLLAEDIFLSNTLCSVAATDCVWELV